MKTLFLLPLMILLTTHLFAQEYADISNPTFSIQAQPSACPYNEDITINRMGGWEIYQTLDNTWYGPIDSSRCISVMKGGNNNSRTVIDLSQLEPSRALFVRQTLPDAAGLLLPNFAYDLSVSAIMSDTDTLAIGNFCANDFCSGAFAIVEVPDETGTGIKQRVNTGNFSDSNGYTTVQACFVTEYFEKNVLREVILKFSFLDEALEGELQLSGVSASGTFNEPNFIQEIVFPQSSFTGEFYSDNLYNVIQPDPNYYESPYIFVHDPEVYPATGNETYIEARPEVPTGEAVELRATFETYQSIFFQPYTGIRGALVDPEDTIRHRFTLVGENMDMCFPTIVELVVSDGAEVEFRSGNIHFGGPTSCIMLRDGGAMVIPDGTRFTYGDGVGALALDKGGTIRIGQGSELIINNTAILSNYIDGPDRQVYLELLPGSRLTFGESSRLIRKGHVEDGHMLLNVYMKGGMLDDSRLSARDRRLINRIYPETTDHPSDWLRILGNPSGNELRFSVDVREAGTPVDWTIRDLNGRQLRLGQFSALKGMNREEITLEVLSGGMYLLEVQRTTERAIRKFIVAH